MKRLVGRASDERLLRWIKLRKSGVPAAEIAKRDSSSAPQVIQTTNAVRSADADESDEKTAGHYW